MAKINDSITLVAMGNRVHKQPKFKPAQLGPLYCRERLTHPGPEHHDIEHEMGSQRQETSWDDSMKHHLSPPLSLQSGVKGQSEQKMATGVVSPASPRHVLLTGSPGELATVFQVVWGCYRACNTV